MLGITRASATSSKLNTHMHSETLLSYLQDVLPTLLRWHQSVSPTLLRSNPTGQVRRKEGYPTGQAERKEAARKMRAHLSHLNARKYKTIK